VSENFPRFASSFTFPLVLREIHSRFLWLYIKANTGASFTVEPVNLHSLDGLPEEMSLGLLLEHLI
jgi:hypothetical protein